MMGVTIVGAPKAFGSMFQAEVGDVLHIGPEVDGVQGPSMNIGAVVVSAPGMAAGSKCILGLGDAAAQGGTLVIVRSDPVEGYVALWAGAGRSIKSGQDCGRAAELRLTADDVQAIQLAPFLAMLFPPTG